MIFIIVSCEPFAVVTGVCVVRSLLCTGEVVGFCCGPSNCHHGSVYSLSVKPCTLLVIYDFVDPLPAWHSQLSAVGPLLCALVVYGIYGAPFYLVSWWSLVSAVDLSP